MRARVEKVDVLGWNKSLSLYCDEEGIGGLSYLLSDRLSLVSAFPLNYIEEENK